MKCISLCSIDNFTNAAAVEAQTIYTLNRSEFTVVGLTYSFLSFIKRALVGHFSGHLSEFNVRFSLQS